MSDKDERSAKSDTTDCADDSQKNHMSDSADSDNYTSWLTVLTVTINPMIDSADSDNYTPWVAVLTVTIIPHDWQCWQGQLTQWLAVLREWRRWLISSSCCCCCSAPACSPCRTRSATWRWPAAMSTSRPGPSTMWVYSTFQYRTIMNVPLICTSAFLCIVWVASLKWTFVEYV